MSLSLEQKIQTIVEPQMDLLHEEIMLGHFALCMNVEDTNIDLDALLDKNPTIKYQFKKLN